MSKSGAELTGLRYKFTLNLLDGVNRTCMKISITEAISKLPLPSTATRPGGVWDVEAFRHGSMSLVLYTPEGKDYQTPHEQDELYVVMQGSGVLEVNGEAFSFSEGDALFVPAGAPHKFVKFSHGIKLWAMLWGDKGGEPDDRPGGKNKDLQGTDNAGSTGGA